METKFTIQRVLTGLDEGVAAPSRVELTSLSEQLAQCETIAANLACMGELWRKTGEGELSRKDPAKNALLQILMTMLYRRDGIVDIWKGMEASVD